MYHGLLEMQIQLLDLSEVGRLEFRRWLRAEDFEVRATMTGHEAVEAFSSSPPDLLVLDIGLPDADGRDVCQALRTHGVTAPVRPTLTLICRTLVCACCAGNLNAVAQRGNFAVAPSRSRNVISSTLMTTPSVSKSSVRRLSAHS